MLHSGIYNLIFLTSVHTSEGKEQNGANFTQNSATQSYCSQEMRWRKAREQDISDFEDSEQEECFSTHSQ